MLVLDGGAHHGLGLVPGDVVDVGVEPGVLVAVGHVAGHAGLSYVPHNAHTPLDPDHVLAHLWVRKYLDHFT